MERLTGIALAVLLVLGGCQQRAGQEDEVIVAVRGNDAAAVQTYLDGGGDPNLTSREGDPLLYIAAGPKGGVEVMRLLIANGADLELAADNGRTPLANAAGWCDTARVALLLQAGASVRPLAVADGGLGESACKQPEALRQQTLELLRAARP